MLMQTYDELKVMAHRDTSIISITTTQIGVNPYDVEKKTLELFYNLLEKRNNNLIIVRGALDDVSYFQDDRDLLFKVMKDNVENNKKNQHLNSSLRDDESIREYVNWIHDNDRIHFVKDYTIVDDIMFIGGCNIGERLKHRESGFFTDEHRISKHKITDEKILDSVKTIVSNDCPYFAKPYIAQEGINTNYSFDDMYHWADLREDETLAHDTSSDRTYLDREVFKKCKNLEKWFYGGYYKYSWRSETQEIEGVSMSKVSHNDTIYNF